jgi:hypothetical protein
MARTLGELVEHARGILQDATGAPRYSDDDLCRYATEALVEMRRMRPDIFLVYGLETPIAPLTTANFADSLPVADAFFTALVNFVVGRAELREDEYTNDGRAAGLLGGFTNSLTSNGGKK